jgi:hypothetical protein
MANELMIKRVWLKISLLFSGILIGILRVPQYFGSEGEHLGLIELQGRVTEHVPDALRIQLWKIDCSGLPIALWTRFTKPTT